MQIANQRHRFYCVFAEGCAAQKQGVHGLYSPLILMA